MKENTTIDDLAVMIKKSFDHVEERFSQVDKRFSQVDKRFDHIDKHFEQFDKRLNALEIGQEDIKLRLNNVAHRFELKELEHRVEILENRLGTQA